MNDKDRGDGLTDDLEPTEVPDSGQPSDFEPTIDVPDKDETVSTSAMTPDPEQEGAAPERIGGYTIVGKLGEGGMGVVWEAEQERPRRRVALKVMRSSHVVDELHSRMFQREVETLGRLKHPNIAAIYESGHTADGRDFFAMELVQGTTLDRWLAGRPSPVTPDELRLRLRLFQTISEAVHYAHQRGVIHRDLKPANIVITDEAVSDSGTRSGSTAGLPVAKILDFGLARVTDADVQAASMLTEVGMIKGTLPYMAPEQARGDAEAIDVRTDVYALGVIVYEMLAGCRPYDVGRASIVEAVRVICDEPPTPLGRSWTGVRRLDPDIETIAGKALEKEPERRYASAAALGDDVNRYLDSQPILARPPSAIYQLRKLVSRHRLPFSFAALLLVLVVGFGVGMGLLYADSQANLRRAEAAEREAAREAETATRTSSFLIGLFQSSDPARASGETITARAVMDEGALRVRDELADEPIMQARLMHTLGMVYLSLALHDESRSQLEDALALRRRHLPDGHPDIAATQHQLARVMEGLGEFEAAFAAFDEALALYERLGPEGVDGLIDVLGNYGWLLAQQGRFDRSGVLLARAFDLTLAKEPPDEQRLMSLYNNRSTLAMNSGDFDVAKSDLARALELSRRLHGEDHQETANVLTNLGVVNAMAGAPDQSEGYYLDALAIYQRIYGEAHPTVARGLGNVAIACAEQGRFDEALPYFEQSLAVQEQIHGANHPNVAKALTNLGLMRLQTGDARAAVVVLQRAADIRNSIGADDISTSFALYHLASARATLGELEEARRLLERVVAIDEQIFGPESTEVADDLEGLVEVLRELGDEATADRLEARMKRILEQAASNTAAD